MSGIVLSEIPQNESVDFYHHSFCVMFSIKLSQVMWDFRVQIIQVRTTNTQIKSVIYDLGPLYLCRVIRLRTREKRRILVWYVTSSTGVALR